MGGLDFGEMVKGKREIRDVSSVLGLNAEWFVVLLTEIRKPDSWEAGQGQLRRWDVLALKVPMGVPGEFLLY